MSVERKDRNVIICIGDDKVRMITSFSRHVVFRSINSGYNDLCKSILKVLDINIDVPPSTDEEFIRFAKVVIAFANVNDEFPPITPVWIADGVISDGEMPTSKYVFRVDAHSMRLYCNGSSSWIYNGNVYTSLYHHIPYFKKKWVSLHFPNIFMYRSLMLELCDDIVNIHENINIVKCSLAGNRVKSAASI